MDGDIAGEPSETKGQAVAEADHHAGSDQDHSEDDEHAAYAHTSSIVAGRVRRASRWIRIAPATARPAIKAAGLLRDCGGVVLLLEPATTNRVFETDGSKADAVPASSFIGEVGSGVCRFRQEGAARRLQPESRHVKVVEEPDLIDHVDHGNLRGKTARA